ncbi:MAG: hypothetical protein H6654_00740 [Ardenticatenaceae bacterium]|nr:hypothetical protein [Anaerolineales bacterium]MCB8940715.1 hypothetical protein [Ardenticatenaceae bacterium]MCB8972054.1 hypothetical protein [Ardenticatenaceae bacterium]
MRLAFTSRRPFHDGLLEQPLPENDQVNMAYMFGAEYFSFFTLKKLSSVQLVQKLEPYDIIFIPLDVRDIETVKLIVGASNGRYIIYSEGGIADYQLLSPADQWHYLQILRQARAVFLYWEKYLPFFQTITSSPVFYLPYPFFVDKVKPFQQPLADRPNRFSLPAGLAGGSRNGLCSLLAARRLLDENLFTEVDCWLAPANFRQDAEATYQILTDRPLQVAWPTARLGLRKWFLKLPIDYRPLLKLRRVFKSDSHPEAVASADTATVQQGPITLLRRHNWSAYLQRLGHNRLVLDLNNRPTVGRNALDCAALGIPCLSTDYSDLQVKLFPQVTLPDGWDIPEVVRYGSLLQDHGFYAEVTQEAARNLQEFLPERFMERFNKILTEYPEIWEPAK